MIRFLIHRVAVGALMIFGVLLAHPVQAQNSRFNVSGVVADTAGVGVPSATVVVLTRADSILTKFATTDRNGAFTLRRLPAGDYILQVSFVGFQTHREDFSGNDTDVDVGTVTMHVQVSELDELVVSAEHIPFIVRRDTLDYNAAAFATRPNAVVEDLLRRLPGIEVDDDGSITAQGEDVENVLVDGKEFFGSDPTITTKNLPAEAVERVQVYDKPSDIAEFTGIPDGQEEKTINLELKPGAKHGYFGRIMGGYGGERGDDGLYDSQGSINRFSPTTQFSIIANINNVNRPGFAWGDFATFMGGMQGLKQDDGRGGGVQIGGDLNNGFSETLALGLNASHDFGRNSWIRSSYFLSSLDNLQDRVVQQQQLLGSEVSSFVNQTSNQTSDNLTHRVNLNAQATFAEGHDLRLRGNLSASTSSLSTFGLQEMQNVTNLTQNTAATSYGTRRESLGGNAQLTWRKRLNDRGRNIVALATINLNDSDLSSDLSSTTGYYDVGDVVTYDEILQEQSQIGNTVSQRQRLSFSEPLGGGQVLELFGERSAIGEDQNKEVYDITRGTSVFNDLLSSGLERSYSYLRGGLRLNRNTERSWFVVGLQVQGSNLEGNVLDRDEQITNGYTHILPSMNYRVALSETKWLFFQYGTSTREPSMIELQPFADNRDPLNVYVGNPALTPEYSHRLYTEYKFFDQFSFVNLFTSLGLTYTNNKIVLSRSVDEKLRQVVTSVNSDGNWSVNGNVSFGTPIRPIGARINLSNSLLYSTGSEFVNQAENVSRIRRNTVDIVVENRTKDLYDIRAGSRLTFNNVDYSLNEELNQSYVNSTLYASGTYYLGELWTLNTSLNYRIYDQDVFGTGQNVVLLEAYISRLFLQDRAEVQLVGLDLLNQNQGVNFTNSSTYIQEERIESLGRYVMLKFVYHLSGLGSRGIKGGSKR